MIEETSGHWCVDLVCGALTSHWTVFDHHISLFPAAISLTIPRRPQCLNSCKKKIDIDLESEYKENNQFLCTDTRWSINFVVYAEPWRQF